MRITLILAFLTAPLLAACAPEREVPSDLVCGQQADLAANGTTDGNWMRIRCPVSRY